MNWKFWKRSKPTRVLAIEVPDEDEYKIYKIWAATYQKTPEEWIVEHLRNSIPLEFRSKYEIAKNHSLLLNIPIEGALSQLDYVDNLAKLGHRELPKKVQISTQAAYLKAGIHPCMYFDRQPPPHLSTRDCLGSCHHRNKKWQACDWAPEGAHNCPLYSIRLKT